jgi:hypothetical protein
MKDRNMKNKQLKSVGKHLYKAGKILTIGEDGRLYLDDKVLLPGDLVELELNAGDWYIGQVVKIGKGVYKISLLGSACRGVVPHTDGRPINVRRLATRPTTLPPFGEPLPKHNASPEEEGTI